MSENPPDPLSRSLRGPVLWVKHAEFSGPLLLGGFMLLLIFAVVAVWAHFERQKQDESFRVAVATLAEEPGVEPVAQRQAALSKNDGVFHWRAIVWRRGPDAAVPLIWSTKVRGGGAMEIIETRLIPYDEAKARQLELRLTDRR